jgi:endonuclease YncB( thermonuclease family)
MRMNAILIGLGLAAALGLGACAPNASIYADNQPAESHDVKVLAGDRMVIDGQSVTLADAEAPRPAPDAACRAEAIAARQAADAVRSALASAHHVEVQRAGGQGDQRLVNVDGLDLGQSLITQGLAVDRRAVPMDWCLRAANGARVALASYDGVPPQ